MAVERKSRESRIIIPLVLTLALAVTCATFSGVYAKYVKTVDGGTSTVTSEVMYFESDYLTEQGASYTITGNSVTFHLTNYPDALRHSELDVSYTVTVEGGGALSSNQGTLSASDRSEVAITLSNLQPGKTYTVAAVGRNGYEKTLKATFTVKAEEKQVFKRVEQTEYYVLLTVWTQNVTGDVSVTFPTDLLPDNTDPQLTGITAASGTFSDDTSFDAAYSSRTYRFFKTTNTTYTATDFSVTVGTTTAVTETTN